MSLPSFYAAGTVSVAHGGTTATGVGTAWIGKVFAGDLFTDPAQGLFARVTADATSDTSLSINAWPGTTMTAAAYEILITPDAARVQERTRQVLEALGSAATIAFTPPGGMTADDVQAAIEEVFADVEAVLPVPAGGTTGQALVKASATAGDTHWVDVLLAGLSSLAIAGTAGAAGQISVAEQTTNGANKVTITAAATLAADYTVTLPSATGTLMLRPATTVDNSVARYDGVAGIVQASGVVIDDSNNVSGVGTLGIAGTLTVTSADAGATAGPLVVLDRNSASPAAADALGALQFSGRNSAAATKTYAQIYGSILDPTSTSEDAQIILQALTAGSAVDVLTVSGVGVQIGAPTGGAQGAGTLNAAGRIYQSGNQVPYWLTGSATFDPASLSDGAGATTTVTVTGAALGDPALCSFSLTTSGITITAWVSATNTVSVRFQNESGGTLDIASGTLKAWVLK